MLNKYIDIYIYIYISSLDKKSKVCVDIYIKSIFVSLASTVNCIVETHNHVRRCMELAKAPLYRSTC